MDPTACLIEIMIALEELDGDRNNADAREDAVSHLEALAQWLKNGGFAPDIEEALSHFPD